MYVKVISQISAGKNKNIMTKEELKKDIELEKRDKLLVERGYIKSKTVKEVIEMLRLKQQIV